MSQKRRTFRKSRLAGPAAGGSSPGRRTAQRDFTGAQKQTQETGGEATRSKSLKRTGLWLGGLATAFVTAIAVSLGSGLGDGLFSNILSRHSRDSHSAISVNVQPDPNLLDVGAWLFPVGFPISRLKSDYEDINRWAPALGGSPAGAMAFKVSVTALAKGGITITGIEANVIRRSRLTPHILVDNIGQGGGIGQNTVVGLNLDRQEPSASLFIGGLIGPEADSLKGAYFSKYSVDLQEMSTHVFELVVYAQHGVDQWNLRIDYIADGKAEHVVVSDRGRPFLLSGFSERTEFPAIYIPGYMGLPIDYRHTWADAGKNLCEEVEKGRPICR